MRTSCLPQEPRLLGIYDALVHNCVDFNDEGAREIGPLRTRVARIKRCWAGVITPKSYSWPMRESASTSNGSESNAKSVAERYHWEGVPCWNFDHQSVTQGPLVRLSNV
jgi:hypothetical protein